MTRVVVEPSKPPSSNNSVQEKAFKHEPRPFDYLNFNNYNFIVESNKEKCSFYLNYFISEMKLSFKAKVRLNTKTASICSTLTTISISRNALQKLLSIQLNESQTKIIVSLKLSLTPMFSVKCKEIMKRLSQALENSYNADYINNITTTNQSEVETFALLNLVSDVDEHDDDGQICVDLNEFLIKQCGLTSLSSIKISSLSSDELSTCASDSITLRTDNEKVRHN